MPKLGLTALERAVELATGESADTLRSRTICEQRRLVETKTGKPMRVVSKPQKFVTYEEVEDGLDKALK